MKRIWTIFRNLALGVPLAFLSPSVSLLAQPQWATDYPTIVNGASSADISVKLNELGTVYYVMSKNAVSGITAEMIKKNALTPSVGMKGGKITVTANTTVKTVLTG